MSIKANLYAIDVWGSEEDWVISQDSDGYWVQLSEVGLKKYNANQPEDERITEYKIGPHPTPVKFVCK